MLEFGIADETAWRAGLSCGAASESMLKALTRTRRSSSQPSMPSVPQEIRACLSAMSHQASSASSALPISPPIAWLMYWKNGCARQERMGCGR